jgi:hypothetical protein
LTRKAQGCELGSSAVPMGLVCLGRRLPRAMRGANQRCASGALDICGAQVIGSHQEIARRAIRAGWAAEWGGGAGL